MTHTTIQVLSALGVVGQVVVAIMVVLGVLALRRGRDTARLVRRAVWGYELWLAFVGHGDRDRRQPLLLRDRRLRSLRAVLVPADLHVPALDPDAADGARDDHRAARYLLPLPVVGAGVSVYHLLVENGVVSQSQGCLISAPGGCATKWINEFGYMTIPTLALTGFALAFVFLLLAAFDLREPETVS